MVSVSIAMSVTVGTSVVTTMVSVSIAMSVTVGTSVSVSMAVVGISLSLRGPLAPGHGSERASGQTVAVVVADNTMETLGRPGNIGCGDTGVGSNAKTESVSVSVVGISIGTPLSKVVSSSSIDGALVAVADGSRPCGGDTAGSDEGISVAVVSISIGSPLSKVVSSSSIDGALVAVADSSGPGGGDAAGAD